MAKGQGFRIEKISKGNIQKLTLRIIDAQAGGIHPALLIDQLKHAYRRNPDLVTEVLQWRCGQEQNELFARKLLQDLPEWARTHPVRTRTDPEIKRVSDWVMDNAVRKFKTR